MSHIRSRKHHPVHIAALVAATFSIAATAADEATELPEVSVKAAKEVPFKADESANNKFTKPLLDTPQTVQVIKKELLREQGVFSLTDALRNTPGLLFSSAKTAIPLPVIRSLCVVLTLLINCSWMVFVIWAQ